VNFTGVANTVSEIIVQASGKPVSIGISGDWGTGKSSMIELIKKSLEQRGSDGESDENALILIDFNAWLYQGYDDAKAALIDVVATRLAQEAEARKKGVDKAKELLKRVNWLRVGKMTAGAAISLALGIPPIGFAGEAFQLGKKFVTDKKSISGDDLETFFAEATDKQQSLLKSKAVGSPPKEIQQIRDAFGQTLAEMGVTLVVLIDDLDRCLPETAISTLEAIRLLLFLDNTAFVIAADNEMIKNAVKRHFENIDDEQVISYFDKLIQVPIRVPRLGTQDVRAYMLLLFVENSTLTEEDKESIRLGVCEQLSKSWQGKRVDSTFIANLGITLPPDLKGRLESADRLAPIMTTASRIKGNPRLIKRFLNALSIGMSIAKGQGISIDEAHLTKILLFERCGNRRAYDELRKAVNEDSDGRAHFLSDMESAVQEGKELTCSDAWQEDKAFVREWLKLPPNLADVDLRAVLYISRDHAPLITPDDQLTSEGAEVLKLLVEFPKLSGKYQERLNNLLPSDTTIIMDKLLEMARQEQVWGTPDLLDACITMGQSHPAQGKRLALFLIDRPAKQIRTNIVPKIQDESWAEEVFKQWASSAVNPAVKKAIERSKE